MLKIKPNKVNVTYEQFIIELAFSLDFDGIESLTENIDLELSLSDQEHVIFDDMDITVFHMEELYDIRIDDDEWEKMWYNVPVNDLHEQLQNL
ncbi:MAG: hypothetical protein HRS57_02120, partial [Mycoplasmataceae bacterium]|nr:hypothetical protein [Mycoplasmataceae bacterium]